MRARLIIAAVLGLVPAVASANETITYTYDAKGRLTQVAHSGAVNNGVVSAYVFDRTDNRVSTSTIGALPTLIVVPLNGLKVIQLSPS